MPARRMTSRARTQRAAGRVFNALFCQEFGGWWIKDKYFGRKPVCSKAVLMRAIEEALSRRLSPKPARKKKK